MASGLQPCKPVEAKRALALSGANFMLRSVLMSESKTRNKTFNKGSLGSRIDEERSEARNVV
jgi:hypothetical protein